MRHTLKQPLEVASGNSNVELCGSRFCRAQQIGAITRGVGAKQAHTEIYAVIKFGPAIKNSIKNS